jgi:hypothetical protein
MNLKLFTVEIFTSGEDFVSLRGFNFAVGDAFKTRVCWYPFEEWTRKICFFAPNRTKAVKQLERAGLSVRAGSLSAGDKREIPACVSREFAA